MEEGTVTVLEEGPWGACLGRRRPSARGTLVAIAAVGLVALALVHISVQPPPRLLAVWPGLQAPGHCQRAAGQQGGLRGALSALCLLATGDAGATSPAAGTGDTGKFYQLGGDTANPAVVPAGFGPFGVVAGGWTADELEFTVAPALEEALLSGPEPSSGRRPGHVPVRVIAQSDLTKPLEDVLNTFGSMDAVLPDEGDDVRLQRPLLLFSGWSAEAMFFAVRRFREMVALRQVRQEPMAAMAVPRAMRKTMQQLVEEIAGDFAENRP